MYTIPSSHELSQYVIHDLGLLLERVTEELTNRLDAEIFSHNTRDEVVNTPEGVTI